MSFLLAAALGLLSGRGGLASYFVLGALLVFTFIAASIVAPAALPMSLGNFALAILGYNVSLVTMLGFRMSRLATAA